VTRQFRLPLAASIAGHGCVVALLIQLMGQLPPLPSPAPIAPRGIEVILAPPPPVAEIPPPPPEPPPIPEVQPPPPEPPPPVVEAPPPPRPQPKPAVKPPPRRPPPQPSPTQAPLQTTMVPPPAPPPPLPPPTPTGPVVSAAYRAALSSWLESHKRYPDGARERGEEGRAVLRFRVDRSGRMLGYSVVQSTGHPDLDAAIDQMMRGASLPPFPADMTASEVEVSVAIRFGLQR
jgi:periplasmic protein TonB